MFFYSIFFPFYVLGICLAAPFSSKVRHLLAGHIRIRSTLKREVDPSASYLWFHASSLGEFEAGRPLLEQIHADYPQYRILLTFFSPSGYELCKDYKYADVVCYMPFDFGFAIRRFLKLVPVKKAFFIRYEFWPRTLKVLSRLGIEVYSVSSVFRSCQFFFHKAGGFYRRCLRCFTHLFVQDQNSKDLLAGIGISNVTIVGDTRIDRVIQIASASSPQPLVAKFAGSGLVCIAGSSWPSDEEVFIPYFPNNGKWKLIIAPHVISESHLREIEGRLQGCRYVRLSDATEDSIEDFDVLIVNCFGLLSSIYRYGQVAFIGGGFIDGIHNVLEAAVYNVPTVFGPNHQEFHEAGELIELGGAFMVENTTDFRMLMDKFVSDPAYLEQCGHAAGDYVMKNKGTTQRIISGLGL
ncbi:MAG: 3-deoxy-D-manno-octulosonic acid transferase [Bacteroidaceae bacterium]|nr:3-deoxy-D-manno-octulosonic acid transferase [Bacteroidaceae bacterium]